MKETLIGNMLYGQSGGPTSIINTSAYGLFKEAFKHKEIKKIYATNFGIKGILNNSFKEIINNKNLKNLSNTPGAFFGSNRYKLKQYSEDPKTYEIILDTFKKNNIVYFFYNGGNDSMDTIRKISDYFKLVNYKCNCIGIIKTIDNDLVNTDFSLGFPSAAKFIINSVIEITLDDLSYETGRVNIIETMGRNTGWLAASSKLASLKGYEPDLIYVPEVTFDKDDFLKRVKEIYEKKNHCIVVISEGIKDEEGHFISEMVKKDDGFGHNQLGGASIKLAALVTRNLGYKTRYFELSLLQRANSLCQSKTEKEIALKLSRFALKAALKGKNNLCVTIKRVNDNPYKYKFVLLPIGEIANKERNLPLDYVDTKNCSINASYITYLAPLIDGEDGLLKVYKEPK
jgi:6-phosphofructokinase